MGFKKMKNEFSFADVVLENSKKQNRIINKMQSLSKSINWERVEDKGTRRSLSLAISPAQWNAVFDGPSLKDSTG